MIAKAAILKDFEIDVGFLNMKNSFKLKGMRLDHVYYYFYIQNTAHLCPV